MQKTLTLLFYQRKSAFTLAPGAHLPDLLGKSRVVLGETFEKTLFFVIFPEGHTVLALGASVGTM